jgi:predicted helicase
MAGRERGSGNDGLPWAAMPRHCPPLRHSAHSFPVATLDTLLSTLPSASKARGDAFERLAKWYLENSPVYSALLRRVWPREDWPGRWGRDAGIDLVAEANDGKLWAIQAKAYEPTTSITKQDVDSFLSESARDVFGFRLLLATTDQIGQNARQVFGGQAIPASLRLLSDLAAEPLDWPDSFDDLRPPVRRPAAPRPHQTEALDAIVERLSGGGRGRVIMACGTGKTFVQLWAHERFALALLNENRELIENTHV